MPTFREDLKLGTKVPQIRSDDISDGSVTMEKLSRELRAYICGRPKETDVSIGDIDLAGRTDSYLNGERASRLRLIANVGGVAVPVGVLDVIADPMRHQLTQMLRTSYVLKEGEGTIDFCSHIDGRLFSYYRFYNHSMANAPEGLERGQWSKWKQGTDDFTMSIINSWADIGSITDAEIDMIIDENLKHAEE